MKITIKETPATPCGPQTLGTMEFGQIFRATIDGFEGRGAAVWLMTTEGAVLLDGDDCAHTGSVRAGIYARPGTYRSLRGYVPYDAFLSLTARPLNGRGR